MDRRKDVKFLIPAAGQSKRFSASGHQVPKPDLKIRFRGRTQTMLGHVLRELPTSRYGATVVGLRPALMSKQDTHPFHAIRIEHTLGQADTIHQMIHASCVQDCPIVIVNCDAIIPALAIHEVIDMVLRENYSMACVVEPATNAGMSFVDSVPHPHRFVEKDPISGWGMSGAWAFRSSQELKGALEYNLNHRRESKGEPYLSHCLSALPGRKYAYRVAEGDVIDWNTPEALEKSGAEIVTEQGGN